MPDQPFLDTPPSEHFDATMELAWITAGTPITKTPAVLSYRYGIDAGADEHRFDPPVYVLCQKYRGAFRSVWVRVPVETP